MKFRINFTVDAQNMFGMLAKMLPVEDVHIEELEPARPRLVHNTQIVNKAQIVKKRGRRGASSLSLNDGCNKVIMEALADGSPHTAVEIKPWMKAAGLSENSVSSRLAKLRDRGVLTQLERGLWQIAKKE